ncbi:MAG: DNA helicase RecG, partial [Peptococcales bacterium]
VGRGQAQSYCILIAEPKTEEGKARMRVMTESTDGFFVAEQDLKIRGPGEFFGTKQHGLPDLKIADLIKDSAILEKTKKIAEEIIKEGLDLPKYQKLKLAVTKKFKNENLI